jgi:hypothetical protein
MFSDVDADPIAPWCDQPAERHMQSSCSGLHCLGKQHAVYTQVLQCLSFLSFTATGVTLIALVD